MGCCGVTYEEEVEEEIIKYLKTINKPEETKNNILREIREDLMKRASTVNRYYYPYRKEDVEKTVNFYKNYISLKFKGYVPSYVQKKEIKNIIETNNVIENKEQSKENKKEDEKNEINNKMEEQYEINNREDTNNEISNKIEGEQNQKEDEENKNKEGDNITIKKQEKTTLSNLIRNVKNENNMNSNEKEEKDGKIEEEKKEENEEDNENNKKDINNNENEIDQEQISE